MFGVRLTKETDALHRLEGNHAIETDRALVGIKDVEKLLELAGAIYGIAEPEFSS
ncbi:hypothetical protein J2T09_005448 [Neorhizobium huautlense]|uniref:Uncharacterized protein n=1 Tax=Neorhizobium huautlense TaxID=67774 RepID=A0ABT9Q1Q6_9HYPH|nr:hypothetical protein [Neorhizobium huautlense]MDP9840660.1 hypothetical protein [Neorhizobium huautlense]